LALPQQLRGKWRIAQDRVTPVASVPGLCEQRFLDQARDASPLQDKRRFGTRWAVRVPKGWTGDVASSLNPVRRPTQFFASGLMIRQ
jgi:hypothetical protein